jgi:hypothetical protein
MLGTFLIYFIVLEQFWFLIININPLFIKLLFALFNLYFIFKNLNIFTKMESILTILIFITFVDMAFYLKRGLIYDYKLSPNLANIILFFSILPLVFFEPFSLIKLISLVSEIFLGFNMLIICLIYLKLKDKIYFKFSNYLIWSLILIFLFGIIYGLLLQK